MRKSKEQKVATRKQIVEAAALNFGERGISGTVVSDVMTSAGLTHGGSYRHFESKEQLLSESLQCALDKLFSGIETEIASETRAKALEAAVRYYLNPARRDDYNIACPLAALASELPRASCDVRAVASAGINRFIDTIQKATSELPSEEMQSRAVGIFAIMVGGMVLSRLAATPEQANHILDDAQKFALQL